MEDRVPSTGRAPLYSIGKYMCSSECFFFLFNRSFLFHFVGVVNPTYPPTIRPSSSGTCISTLSDCFGRRSGDYAYCDNCRMYATCASSGFYVRNCPGIAVFDAGLDKCVDYSESACRIVN